MMDEKTMVSDTLTGINGELKMYAEYISPVSYTHLRSL